MVISVPLHIVLTRYNVELPDPRLASRGLDRDWLSHRLSLFSRWTAASMRAQSRKPDRWIVFVNMRTPEPQLGAIRNAVDGVGEIALIDGPLTDERIAEHVSSLLPGSGTLITTRIDNDDAVASTYIEMVQKAAATTAGFISFPSGYVLSRGLVFRCRDNLTPFISFVETFGANRRTVQTVCQAPHCDVGLRGLAALQDQPAYLQVIHNTNIANKINGLVWPSRWAERDLGMTLPSTPVTWHHISAITRALFRQLFSLAYEPIRRFRINRRDKAALSTGKNEADHRTELSAGLAE
jgi:hypothetical protein